MSALRVAIIGTGMIARTHVRSARVAGAEVIGVLGSSPERSVQAAREWGLASGYRDLAALLADRPDVVHVCTPNDTHAAYGREIALAGVHLIVEKPIATTLAEAEDLVDAAEHTGIVATVPFVYRYHPLVREIRARRAAGELGEVGMVHGTYLQDWMLSPDAATWRTDPSRGGASRAFADIGSHWCDLAEFLSGETFTEVSATMSILRPTRPAGSRAAFSGPADDAPHVEVTTEDSATATFRTSRGIIANTVISQVSAGRKNRLWLEIDGTAGSAAFDQEEPESIWFGNQDGARVLRRGEGRVSPDQARLNFTPAGHSQGWVGAFDGFVADSYAAVRGEHPEGLPTLADGLRSVRIVDAVLRSARAGVWTSV